MRLPVYEQQVRLAPRNQTDLNVRANPNAFGAQIGAAVVDVGKGLGALADAKRYRDSLLADAEGKAAYKAHYELTREVLYDPQTGALVQTGTNAMGESRAQAEARIKESRNALAAKLGPEAREIFEAAADNLELSTSDSLIKHEATATREVVNSTSQAMTDTHLQAAIDNYSDDAKWQGYLDAALGEVAASGQVNGLPSEEVAKAQADITSKAHSNRAIRIAYDDPSKADAYLDAHREELGEAEYSRLKTGMEAAVIEDKAEKAIDGLAGDDGYVGPTAQVDSLGRESYIVGPESGGSSTASNPNSTATGSVQFLSGTYLEWVDKVNPAWAEGLTREEILATRADPVKEAEIYRAFRDNNLAILAANGIPDTPRNRYVMHHFGPGGGVNLIMAEAAGQGNIPVVDVVGQAVVDANPHLKGRTVSGALSVLQGKVNAHGGNGGLSARAAYEEIMKIEDPKVRDAALVKLDQRFKTEEALDNADRRAASDEAWRMFTQEGMSPQSVPMDLQIAMGREGTLNFFESARAYESGTLVTDENRYSELHDLAVEDPQAFADLDLNADRLNFSKSDFRAIEAMQNEIKASIGANEGKAYEATQDPGTMKEIRTNAEAAYDLAVPKVEGQKRTQAEGEAYNRFQDQVAAHARQFMTETGRPMTGPEQDRLYSMLLTPVLIENRNAGFFGGRGGRDAMMFDAPYRQPGERVRANESAENVTLADEEEARAELKQFYGREPSDDEILVHHNRKLLADMGVSPEMEYKEIPSDVRRKLVDQYPDASDDELIDIYLDFVLETAQRP